jgi:hypothetical protein
MTDKKQESMINTGLFIAAAIVLTILIMVIN